MTSKPKHKRSVGRPKDSKGEAGRSALIAAGSQLFSNQGYAATTIALLAKEAGVTPAMVHYYFGGKDKLLQAVLAQAYGPLVDQILEIETLEEWVHAVHAIMMKNRWLPLLMQREVLMEGGHLKATFLTEYAVKFAPKWIAMLMAEKKAGRLRPDVNEFRHMVFLLALIVYPFLVGQIVTPLQGGLFSDDELYRFRDDALAMFRNGTSPQASGTGAELTGFTETTDRQVP
ncbi:MAG: TetR/AcrR family transcriptional regulator [Kordiimonadaceae bacterium]|nr:TetR/AcrR family transcriptional regulator [Kordiimonadaceae bacterium]